jgi:molecular chaperone GrpE (heat shock protein)
MSVPEPDARARLREIVLRWLDELDTPEPPPEGVAPEVLTSAEEAPDLSTLLGQLVALTREVQLQGRATNRLHADLSGAIEHMNQSLTSARQLAEVRREARHEVIGELLEVRDRLTRGFDETRRRLASLRGLRARLGQRPVLTALVEGTALARERLDDALRRLDVHEIACHGEPFDPTLMQAVEVVEAAAAPPGTVIEVFRPGYTSNGRVLRFAEVKVAAGTPAIRGDQ